ncbi:DUF5689 domain-containing protein [Prevotella sp.]|uniref:DUF5689 domain-containing protein n=1 Tax=Prevotella sp. TaxID=59823 RepID=UPI003DA578D4
MKNIKYIMLALVCTLFTGCMDGNWDEPTGYQRGNTAVPETNVMTIAQVKAKYQSTLSQTYGYTPVTDDIQIKAYVTGNDIEGNLFSQISLEDGTGAMLVGINEGGINGYLPVGTEIIVNLKGLYIGCYGMQPQIGDKYLSAKGEISVGRMSKLLWDHQFKYTGKTATVSSTEFNQASLKDAQYLTDNAGKLMTIKGVTFADGGQKVYSNKADVVNNNCCERALNGLSSYNIVVRTSTYADFAAEKLPSGKVNITGIFTRYNNKWQVIIRKASDVENAN